MSRECYSNMAEQHEGTMRRRNPGGRGLVSGFQVVDRNDLFAPNLAKARAKKVQIVIDSSVSLCPSNRGSGLDMTSPKSRSQLRNRSCGHCCISGGKQTRLEF